MAGIRFTGLSGLAYLYDEYPADALWRKIPGNYAFLSPQNQVIYIGQTSDFSERRPGPSHERWEAAKRLGASKVVAHRNDGGEIGRCAEEGDLIRAYDPPANRQLRPKPSVVPRGMGLLSGPAPLAPRKGLLSDW